MLNVSPGEPNQPRDRLRTGRPARAFSAISAVSALKLTPVIVTQPRRAQLFVSTTHPACITAPPFSVPAQARVTGGTIIFDLLFEPLGNKCEIFADFVNGKCFQEELPMDDSVSESPKPRTPKQIAASRRNGARSRGPVTESGKRRSSGHNTRH